MPLLLEINLDFGAILLKNGQPQTRGSFIELTGEKHSRPDRHEPESDFMQFPLKLIISVQSNLKKKQQTLSRKKK